MKKQTRCQQAWSFLLCMVLIAAMALTTMGCDSAKETPKTDGSAAASTTATTTASTADSSDETKTLGTGNTSFAFAVTDGEGNTTHFTVKTDKKTVGEALLDVDLIAGEDGPYGLYVKTVNGITVDYDKDGKYWAFYVNGGYASAGVDATDIETGATYAFKVE